MRVPDSIVSSAEHAHNLVKVNPRLEAALKERAALSKDDTKPETVKTSVPEKPAALGNPGLKGVSQSLIDKVKINVGQLSGNLMKEDTNKTDFGFFVFILQIRAREAAKAQKQMTMNPEEIKRQGMSKLLPELARIVNSIFVTEKKAVLPLRPLIEKIQYSYNGVISSTSAEEHVRLMHTVIPEWLTILNRATIDYVKISRNIDSNIVYQKLEDNAKISN